ncbi:MAG: hypothetical protein A2V66_02215 [Ignavibacteria bacterium RBG_13_36_8]|nr:MAG: hypothetical protein A2V66_02215 [Ignavibacteria bacterium RBG_13_36_8]
MGLVSRPVFKTGSRRIKPSVAGSIPALSAKQKKWLWAMVRKVISQIIIHYDYGREKIILPIVNGTKILPIF